MTATEYPCPCCDDAGCDECDDRGFFLLTECPAKIIDYQLQECFSLADLFKEGIPPAAGGALDQTKWFVSFCTRLWSDENRINAAKESF